jgi:hypothetical protein
VNQPANPAKNLSLSAAYRHRDGTAVHAGDGTWTHPALIPSVPRNITPDREISKPHIVALVLPKFEPYNAEVCGIVMIWVAVPPPS